jgi:hypothetical protein
VTVSRPSQGSVRPSIVALSGGRHEAARRSIERRQVLVDAVRSLSDDDLADLMELAESVSRCQPLTMKAKELHVAIRGVYRKAGWE